MAAMREGNSPALPLPVSFSLFRHLPPTGSGRLLASYMAGDTRHCLHFVTVGEQMNASQEHTELVQCTSQPDLVARADHAIVSAEAGHF